MPPYTETLTRLVETNGQESAGTLASTVYDRLRGDILSGSLPPGEKLRTEALRTRYEVGNSPIREALNRLSADGLVTREDQKGFRVASASLADLEELLKTRCWLEEIALRESITNGDADWEERLVLAFHRLSRVRRSSSEDHYSVNPQWEDLHRAFHLSLLSACGSRWLLQYCAQLNDQADRYRQLAIIVSYPKRNELTEHEAMTKAATDRNVDEAVSLLLAHYERTARIIRETISEFEES
ncbi:MAG: GntR family transcriptional regulator [Rhodospirillaceae bacterium]|nr:GntR family transcriptional regulator [Rhodospirillaceae bacterium]|tara:strand:- start:103867 stop:104589 length:723 start_codon:yes stop_codon:yes gene_type:complete